MTPQQTFDCAVKGILEQKTYGLHNGDPVLRGDNGTKCVVGFLIGDEYYSKDQEGICVDLIGSLVSSKPLNDALEQNGHDLYIAKKLQDLHDTAALNEWPFEEFIKELRKLAQKLNLVWGFDDYILQGLEQVASS